MLVNIYKYINTKGKKIHCLTKEATKIMILSASSSLLTTATEQNQFNPQLYDENSKDIKNSVNSSSSSVSECSSASPTRPLSSCSPYGAIDSSYHNTSTHNHQKKSTYLQQNNRFHPYYCDNSSKHNTNAHLSNDTNNANIINQMNYPADGIFSSKFPEYGQQAVQSQYQFDYDYNYQHLYQSNYPNGQGFAQNQTNTEIGSYSMASNEMYNNQVNSFYDQSYGKVTAESALYNTNPIPGGK